MKIVAKRLLIAALAALLVCSTASAVFADDGAAVSAEIAEAAEEISQNRETPNPAESAPEIAEHAGTEAEPENPDLEESIPDNTEDAEPAESAPGEPDNADPAAPDDMNPDTADGEAAGPDGSDPTAGEPDSLPEEAEDDLPGDSPDTANDTSSTAGISAITEGLYTIVPAGSASYALDIRSGSFSSGAAVQLYKRNNSTAQTFSVKKTSDEYYTLQAMNSGLYVNVKNGTAADKTGIQQYKNDGTKAVKWKLVSTGDKDGSVYIQYYNTGYTLDVANGRYANSAALQIYKKNKSKAQKFLFVPAAVSDGWKNFLGKYRYVKDGSYLKNQEIGGFYVGSDGSPFASVKDGVYVVHAADADGMVLDVESTSAVNKANIQLYKGNSSAAQRFRFTSKGSGYYLITSAFSGKAVDVSGGVKTAGRNIFQYKENGSDAQLWRVMRAGADGNEIKLVSKGSALTLSRSGHGTKNKTNIVLQYKGSEADSWKLVKSTAPTVLSYGRQTYQIASASNTKKVIDVKDAKLSNKAAVQLWSRNSNAAQFFRLHRDGSMVRIQAEHSAKYLNVQGGKAAEDKPVIQYIHDGTKASLFKLVPVSETSNDYYIQYGDTDYVLGIKGNSAKNGASLVIQKKNGSKTQQFRFLAGTSTSGRNTAAVRAEEILNRIGWKRRAAFDYAKVPYQTFDSNEWKGLEWNANYGYQNRRGNCFIRAAQFCMMARVMGEEAYLVRGYVPTATSRIRHGWVEMTVGGELHVFDVSYNSYGYANTYNVAYGSKGSFRYVKQGRVE